MMADILPARRGFAGSKYVGSIDDITAHKWAKEWGVSLYSKEFNKLARERVVNDADYSRFKCRPS